MRLFESNVKVKNQVDYWLVANSLSCRHLGPRLCLVRKRSLAAVDFNRPVARQQLLLVSQPN